MSPDKKNPKSGTLWLGRAIAAILLVATAQAWASVSVTLSAPAGGSIYTSSSNITLTADASAGKGFTLSKVEFFSGSSLIGTDFSAPYGVTWAGAPLGQHSLTAKATAIKKNNPDQTATSAAVDITVKALLHYVHVDHLNTPRLVADAAGATVWKWDQQEPFGVNAPDENPSGLGTFEFPLRFPGQYADKETNLHYNYFRDYDPSIGRYGESDPIGLRGGLNTYGYVMGSPLANADFLGLAGDSLEDPARPPSIGFPDVSQQAGRDAARQLQDFLNKLFCPDCDELQAHIKVVAEDLRSRYFRMLNDPLDLYAKAYCYPSLGRRIGTWLGHGDQIQQKKNQLAKLIRQADAISCPVDPMDRALLTLEPPNCPAAR